MRTFTKAYVSLWQTINHEILVNDILKALRNVNVQLYADDTVLSVSGANPREVGDSLQHNLNRFQSWCEGNKLTIKPSKSKLVTFGTRHSVKRE